MSFGLLGALGRGFGSLGGLLGGAGTSTPVPAAVVLTWDEDTADTTPDFLVDLPLGNGAPLDVAVDDVLHIEYQPAAGGAFTSYLDHTIIQADIDGTPIAQSGVTPIASGDYKFRGRLERGATLGTWSVLEDVTIAAVGSAGLNVYPYLLV